MEGNTNKQTPSSSATLQPGIIKSIKVTNFMCHESFELDLGPRVNFIIGPNGSGKSAILTALVVAFGGRATITSRARKVSDFVMYGKSSARITIKIHNYDKIMEKNKAFKPDDYGKFIIVEKTIYKEDTYKLALKNDREKKISERKQELDDMLEHFGILINNPICILNQEVSKTFLHSKRSEDKYDLFMKATNLEQIEQDYLSAYSTHRLWDDFNKRSTIAFKLLDSEYASCQEKASFLERRARLNDDRAALVSEMFWALVRDNEVSIQKLKEQIQKTNNNIEEVNEEIGDRTKKLKNYEEDLEMLKSKSESLHQQIEETRKKSVLIGSKGPDLRMRQVSLKQQMEQCEKKISRLQKDKKDIEKAIDDLRKQLREQNALDNDSEKRKSEIERLEKELDDGKAKERSLGIHISQLSQSMTQTRGELHNASTRTSELKNKRSSSEALLRRLKNSQENALRKYGDFMIKIIEEIDKAHGQGRFKHKPIGPLGYYLKLENQDIAAPLEIHLGRTAYAFLCDNHQDMSILSAIFKKLSTMQRDFKQPMILMRSFVRRHDVSRYRACHDTYKTLLDYLDIENDAVYNAVVDRSNVECVLYIPDYVEAQNLLLTRALVPPNTRCAYTKDSSVMYPISSAGGYRSYANDTSRCLLFSQSNSGLIKQTERDIDQLNSEIRDAENVAKKIQESLNAQRSEYDRGNDEIRRVIDECRRNEELLVNLKLTVTHQPQELQGLEEERENFSSSIATETARLEKFKNEYASVEADIVDFNKEKAECTEILKLRDKERLELNKRIGDTKESMIVARDFIKHKTKLIENREKEADEMSTELDRYHEELAKKMNDQPVASARPTGIRDTTKLKEEIRKVDAQIRANQEELVDPEEALRNLYKRMDEIKNMTHLKDLNLTNAQSTAKTLDERKVGFGNLQRNTCKAVSSTFSSVMRSMKMNGILEVNVTDLTHRGEVIKKAKTLEISVDTNPTPSQRVMGDNNNNSSTSERRSRNSSTQPIGRGPSNKRVRMDDNDPSHEKENTVKLTDTRSLSGGERSFSTVAFVLALWHHCSSPFKLMDEIDVFMDMVTRRISYNALIRFAEVGKSEPGQFIFFSPLELPKIDDSASIVRVFEMPSIIRKGADAQSQAAGSSTAPAS